MMEWLAENWGSLLIVFACAAERFQFLSTEGTARLRAIMQTLEDAKKIQEAHPHEVFEVSNITAGIASKLGANITVDTILDKYVQPKDKPRVSKGARVGRFLLNILPVVSRLIPK